MNTILTASMYGALAFPYVAVLLVALRGRRWFWNQRSIGWPRKVGASLFIAAISFVSLLGYAIYGMSFEDNSRPDPLWWLVGFSVTQLSLLASLGLAITGIGAMIWRRQR